MSLGAEKTGFVLCEEQWQGCVLAKTLHAREGHAGMHLPGFAEEETHGGIGLLAWRDPLSAP